MGIRRCGCWWCPWPDSNQHGCDPPDFESGASTNSATGALRRTCGRRAPGCGAHHSEAPGHGKPAPGRPIQDSSPGLPAFGMQQMPEKLEMNTENIYNYLIIIFLINANYMIYLISSCRTRISIVELFAGAKSMITGRRGQLGLGDDRIGLSLPRGC